MVDVRPRTENDRAWADEVEAENWSEPVVARLVRNAAIEAGCTRLWLITTNDNLRALGFYQKRGWKLAKLHKCLIDEARKRAKHCKACPLYKLGTQTVFGEGPEAAKIVFVGEQPGDQEDRQGHPFVGPAGQLLDLFKDRARVALRDRRCSSPGPRRPSEFRAVEEKSGRRRTHAPSR